MKYLLRTTMRTPPHSWLYITHFNENGFYYHSSNKCDAHVWNTEAEAIEFRNAHSRGGTESSAYTKHEVIAIFGKDWFYIKLEGKDNASDGYDPDIEDCGCDLCRDYIAENGTMSEQIAMHKRWTEKHPVESKALREEFDKMFEAWEKEFK